jgi:endoglucanase
VRLVPDKWDSRRRDFLVGNCDRFTRIPARDLATLRTSLDWARERGIGVVLTMLSLPGARWSQNNDGEQDGRLWSDEDFQDQAIEFWTQLATAVRDDPNIVAYNPLNEPHPARALNRAELGEPSHDDCIQRSRGVSARRHHDPQRVRLGLSVLCLSRGCLGWHGL